jgi:hypothetical protein
LVKKLKKLGSYKIFISDKVGRNVYKKVFQFLKENLGKVDFLLIDALFIRKNGEM